MSEAKHKCGICGCHQPDSQEALYKMLLQMQHRGQLSAGITTLKENHDFLLKTHKDLGVVNHVFRAENKDKFSAIMNKMSSNKGIGHVRYSTCGCDDREYAQPFEHFHGKRNRWFSIAFNGNIANFPELVSEMEKENYHFVRKTDTEILLLLLAKFVKKSNTLTESFSKLAEHLDGSYNLAFIDAEGKLACARDPLGIRPLCYGEEDGKFAFASESVALQSIGFKEIKDVAPGEIIIHHDGETKIENFAKSEKKAHCFFEWIYFAHAASKIDGKLVYNVRYNLGRELAKVEKEKIDDNTIVVAVPDSSTPCGNGFAHALGIRDMEGLIRNRYVGRTFIESKDRADRVKSKFMVVREVFEGKKVFLLEDSIVRGTTLKGLISLIKKYGNPKEIHIRVSSPPILWPCFYGIDMSTKKELIANNKKEEELAKEFGVNSVRYQTIPGLIKALGINEDDLCLACLNGDYPTPFGEKRAKEEN